MALEMQNNPSTSLLLVEAADVEALPDADPAAGQRRLAVGTDHLLYLISDAGVKTLVGAAGSVATDAIWDAAGDLAVGSGANTAAKLTLGAAGGALSRVNGAVAWNSGTSFPTAATGDRYWRTDLGMEFYYDGTRWLSMHVMVIQPSPKIDATATTAVGELQSTVAATAAAVMRWGAPSVLGCSNIWLVDYKVVFLINGGTALSASHKWVFTLTSIDLNGATVATPATITIDSGSLSVYRESTAAIAAAQGAGVLKYHSTWTKTGTPGAIQTTEQMTYRIIAT